MIFLIKYLSLAIHQPLTINLPEQTITINETGEFENFEISNYKKTCLGKWL